VQKPAHTPSIPNAWDLGRLLSLGPTTTRRSLPAFWAEAAFAAGGTDFLWVDVAIAAMARGEWPAFERRLTEGLASAARAQADKIPADDRDVDAAATAFRYDRDLISGDEINAWLERAALNSSDWLAYFRRDLLRRRFEDQLDETIDGHAVSTRQLLDAAYVEGVCSGQFDAFARTLAHRIALAVSVDPDLLSPDQHHAAGAAREAARLAHLHRHWVEGRADDEVQHRFEHALRIERAFHQAADAVATPGELHAVLETRQIDWTHLTFESLSLSTEHAAREALLCLTVDGMSLDDVSLLARQAVTRTAGFLEDLPADWRVAMLSAETGRPIGPLPSGGRFGISVVTGHAPPELGDPRVEERARRAAVAGASERAAQALVRWPERV
jgi:hypothetical protein